jgi:hypothetical protein
MRRSAPRHTAEAHGHGFQQRCQAVSSPAPPFRGEPTPAAAAVVRAIRRAMAGRVGWGDGSGLVAFRVEDIHDFAARLVAQGVTVHEPPR